MSTSTSHNRGAVTSPMSWRVNDIVVASVLGVACALIFWVWNNAIYPAANTATAAAPQFMPLIGGGWLIAGVLGGLVIRKPGAALYTELLAAIISAFIGSAGFGITVIYSGLVQGLGAELVFAVLLYKRWGLTPALLSGAVAGLFMGVYEVIVWNPEYSFDNKIIYVICAIISGTIIAGLGAWVLTRALLKTGVLSSLASGRQSRR
ncbi:MULTISPECIES: ECF transporter S component [unclassified Rothia (in: high G+C Gram-positive bacteria)]|uniref:ECF transporter S component n=1 Tax=unclassified Rothia (in: high G+C Gram-positive bacteria) TaxID=2689056 RepID=UPI00195CFEFB|nr:MULTISPECIES: ECF transporter S component [unclassified Rothia (in: high G+C Gram-positive bacteria)]MBM7051513.1 ECF transporter S component [Rothia sp. ZJ1223]QRZ61296.1 ECF transporter S component [Rothia sp. ZJ932]